MNKIYDLIILGGGPVGLYATFLSGLLKLDVLCLEIDNHFGGQATKLYPFKMIHDYPGYLEVKATKLVDNLIEQANRFENTELKHSVEIIDFVLNEEIIELIEKNGNKYFTKNVLFTVGPGAFEQVKISKELIFSDKDNNIMYKFDNKLDFSNKKVLVFGGGDSAVDYAHQIKTEHKNTVVSLIHRGDKLKSMLHSIQGLESLDIEVILNTVIDKIENNKCWLLQNDNLICKEYHYILVQFGLNSLGSKVHSWEKFEKNNKNKFIVNEKYETSIKNFYAAGNCCHNINKIDFITLGMCEAGIVVNQVYNKKLLESKDN